MIKSFEGIYSATPGNTSVPVQNLAPDTTVYAYQRTYQGVKDLVTIGWGTTRYRTGKLSGRNVVLGDSITVQEADAEIRSATSEVYAYINKNLSKASTLTNGQAVALISIGYNVGTGNLKASSVWKAIESGEDTSAVASKILQYGLTAANTSNVLPGLVNRRKQESQIYTS